MNKYTLKKHTVLYCSNGETVIVEDFSDTHIWVKYKNRIVERPISVINERLFFTKPQTEPINNCDEKTYSPSEEAPNDSAASEPTALERLRRELNEEKKSCLNCKLHRSGECSSWGLCEDYQPAVRISQSDMSYWPVEGDATRFRKKRKNH